MKSLQWSNVCLLMVAMASVAMGQSQSPQPQPIAVNSIDDKPAEKPEARQIGAVLPYNWYQQAQQSLASAPASSWGSSSPSSWVTGNTGGSGQSSLLSILRPSMTGGRRSSLTSRLRNLMSALFFRRETSSPYLASGSSYNYAFRQPPFGFGASGFPSTSGIGQPMIASGSSYRPVVIPNYQPSSSDTWSNYKQYVPGGQSSFASQYGSQSSPTSWSSTGSGGSSQPSSSAWQTASQSGAGTYSSSYPSYSGGVGSGSSANSGGSYQAAASNVYPSTSYQRSSQIGTYGGKPVSGSSGPYSSGSVSSSVSSSSSSSSSSAGTASGSSGKSGGYQSQ